MSQVGRGCLSHSWETLYTTKNLSRHDTMISKLSNQAILPIGPKTARILERGCYPESILIIEEPTVMENPLHNCQKSQQNEIVEKDENHNDLPQSQLVNLFDSFHFFGF